GGCAAGLPLRNQKPTLDDLRRGDQPLRRQTCGVSPENLSRFRDAEHSPAQNALSDGHRQILARSWKSASERPTKPAKSLGNQKVSQALLFGVQAANNTCNFRAGIQCGPLPF